MKWLSFHIVRQDPKTWPVFWGQGRVCVCVYFPMPRASLRPHYVHMSVCRSWVPKPGTSPRQCQGDLSPHALMLSAPQGLMWLQGAVNVLAAPRWTLASPPVLSLCWWEAPRRHLVLKYRDRSLTLVQIHYGADMRQSWTSSLGCTHKNPLLASIAG